MNFKLGYEQHKDLVSLKETSNPDLFVLKYRKKVFFNDLFDDFLEDCRGTVIDKDFNVVSLPFRKIYNFGRERLAPKWPMETEIMSFRKINGFMLSVTSFKDDLLVSTTGSIDSDFVGFGNEFINKNRGAFVQFCKKFPTVTFLFECCHPKDPHIIDEKPGLYLIGAREKDSGDNVTLQFVNEENAKSLGVFLPESKKTTLANALEEARLCYHEGFVLINPADGSSTKIKSVHYLVKKLFMRGNVDKLLDNNIKKTIDEEYFPLVDHISSNREIFKAMNELDRRLFIEEFLTKEV